MDGENNGKPLSKWMIWGYPIFGNIHLTRKPVFQKGKLVTDRTLVHPFSGGAIAMAKVRVAFLVKLRATYWAFFFEKQKLFAEELISGRDILPKKSRL